MKIISRFNRVNMDELLVDESIFALQNGLIGVRGNFSESYGLNDYKQTLINGFYNLYDYTYEENSPSFPQKGQRIINVIDGQTIEFYIQGVAINKANCLLKSLERHFDLEKGLTTRIARYETTEGYEFIITEEKLLSFIQKELLTIKINITSINYDGDINIVSKLKLPNKALLDRKDSRINQASEDSWLL